MLIRDGLTRSVKGQLGQRGLINESVQVVLNATILRVGEDHLLILVAECCEDVTHRETVGEVRTLQSEPLIILLNDGAAANKVKVHSNHPLVAV